MALIYQILSISKTSEALPAIFDNEATSKPAEMWRNSSHCASAASYVYYYTIHTFYYTQTDMHARRDGLCACVRVSCGACVDAGPFASMLNGHVNKLCSKLSFSSSGALTKLSASRTTSVQYPCIATAGLRKYMSNVMKACGKGVFGMD